MGAYVDDLVAEIAARGASSSSHEGTQSPATLYIGGGTPSVLPLTYLKRMIEALGPLHYDEFTVEVNPDDVVRGGMEYVCGLKALGVNRVSMGVQSFDDAMLGWMNRRHSSDDARKAFAMLREAGFGNISVDLIFGISHLSDADWERSIAAAAALGPEHISAYQLSIEEGSALGKMVREGKYEEAPDEQCRRQYDMLCASLAAAGYRHYEISNWAKPGYEAMHNSAYWKRVPYIGLGPGAHSLESEAVRSWNSESTSGWTSECEHLSTKEMEEEKVMLSLRTAEGIGEAQLRSVVDSVKVDALLEDSALVRIPETASLRIPENRFFVSDDVISDLLSAMCI